MQRIHSLDYLRGLLALSIMFYHYMSWGALFPTPDASDFMGRLGIYGVSTFYILSGLSLYLVYKNKFNAPSDVPPYFVKRVFRIYPLLWVAIFLLIGINLYVVAQRGVPYDPPYYQIFVNLSLLFGFIDPSAGMSAGIWSIGNEMVFYVILPFVFIASRWFPKRAIPLFFGLSVLIGIWFSFFFMDSGGTYASEADKYVNPMNQLYLFAAGVWLGYILPVLIDIVRIGRSGSA